jgi:hypothetical protein
MNASFPHSQPGLESRVDLIIQKHYTDVKQLILIGLNENKNKYFVITEPGNAFFLITLKPSIPSNSGKKIYIYLHNTMAWRAHLHIKKKISKYE